MGVLLYVHISAQTPYLQPEAHPRAASGLPRTAFKTALDVRTCLVDVRTSRLDVRACRVDVRASRLDVRACLVDVRASRLDVRACQL